MTHDICSELAGLMTSHGYVAAVVTQTTDVEAELNGLVTYDRYSTVQYSTVQYSTVQYSTVQ